MIALKLKSAASHMHNATMAFVSQVILITGSLLWLATCSVYTTDLKTIVARTG